MKKLLKGNKYIFNYNCNEEVFINLNNRECTVCAKYLGEKYIGIKFENGIETTAYPDELIPI